MSRIRPQKHNKPPKLQDIKSDKQENFHFVSGQKYESSKHIGNLIKIASIGLVLILGLNLVNVYQAGRNVETDLRDAARSGFTSLMDLDNLSYAEAIFEQSQQELWFIENAYLPYSNDSNLGSTVKSVFEIGTHLTEAARHFEQTLAIFREIPNLFAIKNENKEIYLPSISEHVDSAFTSADLALAELEQVSKLITNLNRSLVPEDLLPHLELAETGLTEVTRLLEQIRDYRGPLLKLLGDRYPHRYLILLQNDNEIRPTGGFIGSYILVTINDGFIEEFETHDVYDIDGSFGEQIDPPPDLDEFITNWRLRDSNYSPDFSISGEKARWFLQKQGGPSVDTVIAVNQSMLSDLLEVTGPIQVGSFGMLNAANYDTILSYVIESKLWGANDPKHILKKFVSAFKEEVLKEANIKNLGTAVYKAIERKQVMAYSDHADVQQLLREIGLSGEVTTTPDNEDYLSVINISISYNKSDKFMEQSVDHHSEIDDNGQITNTLTLTRTHLWSEESLTNWYRHFEPFGIVDVPEDILNLLGRGRNRTLTRVYVPEGVELISSSDPEIKLKHDAELEKDYFLTQIEVPTSGENSIEIVYQLPYQIVPDSDYRLSVDKQAGDHPVLLTKTLNVSPEFAVTGLFPEETKLEPDGSFKYATNLSYDRSFAASIE